MESSEIEIINDDNWREAASSLCRAAMFYETLLVKTLEQMPREQLEELVGPHHEQIDLCNAVTKHWRDFLEIRPDAE